MKLDNYVFQRLEKKGISGVYYYKHISNGNTVLIGRCDKTFIKTEEPNIVEAQNEKLKIETNFGNVEVELHENESVKIEATNDVVFIERDRSDVFNKKVKEFRDRRLSQKKTLIERLLGK